MATIQELAEEMSRNFTTKKRKDGSEFVLLKEDVEWQKDVIYEAHEEKLPDDWTYRFVEKVVDSFADIYVEDPDYDDFVEVIHEIEPDVYTSDLTDWLGSRSTRLYYLTQAIEEMGVTDGFQALSVAQTLEIQEVAYSILNSLQELAEEDED